MNDEQRYTKDYYNACADEFRKNPSARNFRNLTHAMLAWQHHAQCPEDTTVTACAAATMLADEFWRKQDAE